MKEYYNKNFDPYYGQLVDVCGNVKRVLANNPSPFTYYGTGTYIVDDEELAIIDPGPNIKSHINNLLRVISKDTKVHIFITHTHADHSPATHILKEERECITYGYGAYPFEKYDTKFEEGHDLEFKPDISLKDGDKIKAKNWTIKAIHTPGHTSNHMCYGLEESSVLFTGDHIMGWATTVIIPPDGDMEAYMNSLKKVLSYNYNVFFPTHGGPIKSPKKFVNALIGHRKMREQQIINELFKNSLTINEMVSKFYKNTNKKLWPAAKKSILATLISLEKKGIKCVDNSKEDNTKWVLIKKK